MLVDGEDEEELGEEELREEPKAVKRLERDMKRPERPRRREATWSFQVMMRFSMKGTMDWVTISRRNERMAEASESKM